MQNQMKYISGLKLNLLGVTSYFGKYFFQWKKYPLFNRSILKNLKELKQLRKDLNLNRAVSYNGKIFSSPIVPAFPSKAFDNSAAHGGLNYAQLGTDKKQQIDTAFLAITDKCHLDCLHCYEKHNINNSSPGIKTDKWKEVINTLQSKGTSVIVLTGGEPFDDFEKLYVLTKFINKELSDVHVHTSGSGVTDEKVAALKEAGLRAAAVGLDDYDEHRYNVLRGTRGAFDNAVNAIELFNKHGIFTYVNCCLTHDLVNKGDLYEYYNFVKEQNIGIIQLLEPRPFGGYRFEDAEKLFTKDDKQKVLSFYNDAMHNKKYDDYPIIYYVPEIESKEKMGCCMGGLSHFYIDSHGNVNGCVFLPVSFGNILYNDIDKILQKMRKLVPRPVKTDCPSLVIGESLKENTSLKLPIEIKRLKKHLPNEIYESIFED